MWAWLKTLLVLAGLVWITPVYGQEVYDMRTFTYNEAADVSLAQFWQAYGIAVVIYGYASPPKKVIIVTSDLFNPYVFGFYDVAHEAVWINITAVDGNSDWLLYVLIHEIGHHLLTKQKVSFEDQHCQMYGELDVKALKLAGLDSKELIDPFVAMGACS